MVDLLRTLVPVATNSSIVASEKHSVISKWTNITGEKIGCQKKQDDLLLFGVWTAWNKKNT